MTVERTDVDSFTRFVEETEPRLKIALCSAFGRQVGLEATADALAYGWEHWARIEAMPNPAGYLWGVGRNRARKQRAPRRAVFDTEVLRNLPWVEPGLPGALAKLSERQRLSVMLIHGFDWTHAEVAELLGVSISTVQKHTERAMARLRRSLKVDR